MCTIDKILNTVTSKTDRLHAKLDEMGFHNSIHSLEDEGEGEGEGEGG
jgi:hypothetical protein